jgi:hypothetical protein
MTTIAYRDGVLASDSQETRTGEESASLKLSCQKLFRVQTTRFNTPPGVGDPQDVIVATAGESSPGMAFVYWLQTDHDEFPEWLRESDIAILVLTQNGLYEYDGCGLGQKRTERFYAVGTGAPYAFGAMERGASASEAVAIAAMYDPYTGGRQQLERL